MHEHGVATTLRRRHSVDDALALLSTQAGMSVVTARFDHNDLHVKHVRALALVKHATARANRLLHLLDYAKGAVIYEACRFTVEEGRYHDQFVECQTALKRGSDSVSVTLAGSFASFQERDQQHELKPFRIFLDPEGIDR